MTLFVPSQRAGVRRWPLVALTLLFLVATASHAFVQPQSDRHEQRNFDARIAENVGLVAPENADQRAAVEALRATLPELAVTYEPSSSAVRTLYNQTGYLTEPSEALPREIALRFVTDNLTLLGLTAGDVRSFEVTDEVFTRATGATRLYLRQTHGGLSVYNAQLQVNINRDGRILSVNNAFLPGLASAAGFAADGRAGFQPALDAVAAVASAAKSIGVDVTPVVTESASGVERLTRVSPDGLSQEPIEARLMWLPIREGDVRLVWNFQIYTLDSQHWYDFTVDATSGRVWTRFDWVNSGDYRVYEQPVEDPGHTSPAPPADARTLAVDPENATASPSGWFSGGIVDGNNVHACIDASPSNNACDFQTSCSGTTCDFPINLNNQPSSFQNAAVANLFYWNNLIHDIQYQYGFDEAGGNFQENNFGNGGNGSDSVNADAQDGGGNCNANFATPTDGGNPRMQMYTCTNASPARDGDLDNGVIVHEYGHGISIRQVGGPGNSSCLNNSQQAGEGWSDWFALAYTHEPGDAGTDSRGIGTYLFGQGPNGPGIRDLPYSTDPGVNNWTYESISGAGIPHGVGSRWAQAIWEVYWALVDQYGFDADLYDANGGAGNQRAMLYVNEGLKNTACSPTFVANRDGIIQAATDNYGGADVCLLWETFAAFGLGTDAVSGGSNSTNPTNGFSIPASCQCQPNPIADAGADQTICQGDSATVGTSAQAGHSYLWSPGGQSSAQITVTPTVDTTYTVTATTSCGSAQDSATVFVDDGTTAGGLDDDFESGGGSWSSTGLWHLTSNSSCASPGYSSPVNAFYYGQDSSCTYNSGAANSGSLTSPVISGINNTSTLTFDYFRQVESFTGGSYDQTTVDIVTSSGSTTVFALDSTDASSSSWTSSGAIDLSGFAGQNIQVRFTFNSVDNVSNDFVGWLIDDVVVTGDSACTPSNTPPTVSIDSPSGPVTVSEGTSVNFTGTASDTEDGDLTGSIAWSSSLDGAFGSGGSASATLSVGSHVVSASVTDSGSLSGSDSVDVTVNANNAPTVSINSPANGAQFDQGQTVSFSGTATDVEDGTLTGSLAWTSSIDGSIGSGGSFSTSSLSLGTHTITASVTDSNGANGSDSISIGINVIGGGCTDCIDWSSTTTVSYSNQDVSGDVTIEDGGDTILLQNNTWRRTTQTFTITPNTVVEFEFASAVQGEIHGLGFDEDDTLTNDVRIFQVHGTQNWGGSNHDFDNYAGGGTFTTYQIPVGQYYTGTMFLVVVNDNDAGSGNDSRFRNVRVYEDVPPGGCAADVDFSGGAAGWTNSGASTCSTGSFVVATPTSVVNGGVTTQVGGDHTSGSGNAFFSATNSSAGVNDVDGGNCIVTSPVYPVADASDVSLWYFHGQRDAGDDASGDFFLLEMSTNGGSSWSTLASNGDSTSNAVWTEATATVAAGSNVQFRVQVSDGASAGDLVEAGVDDVSICPQ